MEACPIVIQLTQQKSPAEAELFGIRRNLWHTFRNWQLRQRRCRDALTQAYAKPRAIDGIAQ